MDNQMQSILNEMSKSHDSIKEELRERTMLQMFAGGASIDDVKSVLKRLVVAEGNTIDDEELDKTVYGFWELNRNDLSNSSQTIHAQVVDWIESNKCNNSNGSNNGNVCKTGCDSLLHVRLQDCYTDLGLKTPGDRTACRMAFKRLVSKDVLEPVGGKPGTYNVVIRQTLEKMKFITGNIPEFPVRLPLDLNDMVKIYPKNIIIIAGSKSSGKSALALWIAVANQNPLCTPPSTPPFNVLYFNSEMGEEEYSGRMQNMGFQSEDEIKFEMVGLHADYDKYITGEKKIFIIDFLEIHENFYEIAKPIRKIHEKLKDGICIILLQMPANGNMGLGKGFSAEKARLYITLNYEAEFRHTIANIYDAKSPKIPDIRGMSRRFKIINGAKISPIDNWHHHLITKDKR